jgi:hypothetical protein
MLFRPPYNAIFEVNQPIYPSDKTSFQMWFGENKPGVKRIIIFIMLTQYVAQGRFTEAGTYLIHVHRIGFKIRGTLYKFPQGASLITIAQFLKVVGITAEGITDAAKVNAGLN